MTVSFDEYRILAATLTAAKKEKIDDLKEREAAAQAKIDNAAADAAAAQENWDGAKFADAEQRRRAATDEKRMYTELLAQIRGTPAASLEQWHHERDAILDAVKRYNSEAAIEILSALDGIQDKLNDVLAVSAEANEVLKLWQLDTAGYPERLNPDRTSPELGWTQNNVGKVRVSDQWARSCMGACGTVRGICSGQR